MAHIEWHILEGIIWLHVLDGKHEDVQSWWRNLGLRDEPSLLIFGV